MPFIDFDPGSRQLTTNGVAIKTITTNGSIYSIGPSPRNQPYIIPTGILRDERGVRVIGTSYNYPQHGNGLEVLTSRIRKVVLEDLTQLAIFPDVLVYINPELKYVRAFNMAVQGITSSSGNRYSLAANEVGTPFVPVGAEILGEQLILRGFITDNSGQEKIACVRVEKFLLAGSIEIVPAVEKPIRTNKSELGIPGRSIFHSRPQ